MTFWQSVLRILDTSMEKPGMYGLFHLLSCVLTVLIAIYLCASHRPGDDRRVRRVVLITAVVVAVLELYKQINYSFGYENGITYDYQWYIFPFQFCSTPMYIGLIAGLTRKGRVHEATSAYLATYAVFAGLCVMLYPSTVFIETIGVNIQTMVCHGSMIFVGMYLLYSGYVKLEHRTILKAIPVFAVCVALAVVMNEIACRAGLLETETFNMFFISPYCEPSLPVYSLVQGVVPFPWCLLIYVAAFSVAAYLMLLGAMGISKLGKKLHIKVAV